MLLDFDMILDFYMRLDFDMILDVDMRLDFNMRFYFDRSVRLNPLGCQECLSWNSLCDIVTIVTWIGALV